MENHDGKGGSYIRNPDGTLSLVERTLAVDEAAANAETDEGEPVADLQPEPPARAGRRRTEV